MNTTEGRHRPNGHNGPTRHMPYYDPKSVLQSTL